MRRVILGLAAALAAGAALSLALHVAPSWGRRASAGAAGPAARVPLGVQGLSSGSCEARIGETLSKAPGVRGVGVDPAAGQVTVEYAVGTADPRNPAQTLTRLG